MPGFHPHGAAPRGAFGAELPPILAATSFVLGAFTLAASASLLVTSQSALSLRDFTVSAAASVEEPDPVEATGSVVLDPLTISAAGGQLATAAAALSLSELTVTSLAASPIRAAQVLTLAPFVVGATGDSIVEAVAPTGRTLAFAPSQLSGRTAVFQSSLAEARTVTFPADRLADRILTFVE